MIKPPCLKLNCLIGNFISSEFQRQLKQSIFSKKRADFLKKNQPY